MPPKQVITYSYEVTGAAATIAGRAGGRLRPERPTRAHLTYCAY